MRKRIGTVELDPEYLEQCVLAKQAPEPATACGAQARIARYLALMAVPPSAVDWQRAETVLDACWPPPLAGRREYA